MRKFSPPPDWKSTKLGDLVSFGSGYGFPRSLQGHSDEEIPFFKVSDMSNENNRRELTQANNYVSLDTTNKEGWTPFPAGAIAFAKVGAALLLNRRRLLVQPSLVDNNMMVAIPGESVDSTFLYWWLQIIDFGMFVQPGVVPSVNQRQVGSLSVPLPSLPEQRRIAEILDAADAAIRETERVIAKLREVKQGLLHDLLTRGLDAHGHLRDPDVHPEQFKDSPLGRIPRAWEVTRLVEHFAFSSGQVDPTQEPYRDWPLIAPDHIESETGRLLKVETAAEQDAISGKYIFEPGDVVYSKIRPYLKKAVLVNQVGLCSADMYPLQPHDTLDSRFLLAVILGEDFSRFAIAVSMRSGFPKINREEMGEYVTTLPPIEEQRRIAAVLHAHDARIRSEEAVLAKRRQVKRGLMDDLLTGRVRV